MMLLIMLLYEEANKKTVHIPVLDNFGKKAESTASETEPTRLGNMIDFNIKLQKHYLKDKANEILLDGPIAANAYT